MNVSSINESNSVRRNLFIQYANSFMSNPVVEPAESSEKIENSEKNTSKTKGIETLETFSIFPKQVINGKTIITA